MCKWLTSQTQIKPTCWRKSNDSLYSFANAFGLKSAYYTTSATNQNLLEKIQIFFSSFFYSFLKNICQQKTYKISPKSCEKWHLTHDMWHATHEKWHRTCEMWHTGRDGHYLRCQVLSLTFGRKNVWKIFSHRMLTDWVNWSSCDV